MTRLSTKPQFGSWKCFEKVLTFISKKSWISGRTLIWLLSMAVFERLCEHISFMVFALDSKINQKGKRRKDIRCRVVTRPERQTIRVSWTNVGGDQTIMDKDHFLMKMLQQWHKFCIQFTSSHLFKRGVSADNGIRQ